MSTPASHPREAHPHRDDSNLADLLEDFAFVLMFFAGAAIVAAILVLMVIL